MSKKKQKQSNTLLKNGFEERVEKWKSNEVLLEKSDPRSNIFQSFTSRKALFSCATRLKRDVKSPDYVKKKQSNTLLKNGFEERVEKWK